MVRAAFAALASFLLLIGSDTVAGAQERTTVILVRHAERESLTTPDPLLTAAGLARALALRSALRDAGIQAIITTQFTRTKTTAAPLSAALGITPEIVPDTSAHHAADVANVIRKKHAGQTVLVVGHGHTVPAIIAALGAPPPSPICESVYDNLFLVIVSATGPSHVIAARYGAESPPDSKCASAR